MIRYLFRCIIIFLLAFSGMTCLVIVDTISGTMVGYEPMVGLTINQIEEDYIVATAFGYKLEFPFGTVLVGNVLGN